MVVGDVTETTGVQEDRVGEVRSDLLDVFAVVERVGDDRVESIFGERAHRAFGLGPWHHVLGQRDLAHRTGGFERCCTVVGRFTPRAIEPLGGVHDRQLRCIASGLAVSRLFGCVVRSRGGWDVGGLVCSWLIASAGGNDKSSGTEYGKCTAT